MINGVLVERTVKDVVPALKINADGLRKVLEALVKEYNAKQVEMEKWKVRSYLRVSLGHGTDVFLAEEEQYPSCPAMRTY